MTYLPWAISQCKFLTRGLRTEFENINPITSPEPDGPGRPYAHIQKKAAFELTLLIDD